MSVLEFSSHQFQIADSFLFSISFSCHMVCCCPRVCSYLITHVNITRGLWRSPRIRPHGDAPINTPAFKATETPQTIFWDFKQEAIILLPKCSLLSCGSHVSVQPSTHAGALLPQDGPYPSGSPWGTHTQWLNQRKTFLIRCKSKLL